MNGRQKAIVTRGGGALAAFFVALHGAPAVATGHPEPVEWVISSDDTLADAVEDALLRHDAAAVAADLEQLGETAASGRALNFPGLDTLAANDAATLLADTADAVEDMDEMPEAAERLRLLGESDQPTFASTSDDPFAWDPDQTYGRVIAQGYAYEQYNWLRRGVRTQSGEIAWTDIVQLRWVANPGAVSSRIDYWLTMPKRETGYFGPSARARTWAFTGDLEIGVGQSTTLQHGTAFSRYVPNDEPMYGQPLWHGTTLEVDGELATHSSSFRTETANCRQSPDRVCTYQ